MDSRFNTIDLFLAFQSYRPVKPVYQQILSDFTIFIPPFFSFLMIGMSLDINTGIDYFREFLQYCKVYPKIIASCGGRAA